jgi:hypothetical protein
MARPQWLWAAALAALVAGAAAQRVNFTLTLSPTRPVWPMSPTSPAVMGANLGARGAHSAGSPHAYMSYGLPAKRSTRAAVGRCRAAVLGRLCTRARWG